MYIQNNKAYDVKITYIGGGSRGWAWNLMSDLAVEKHMSGKVTLYDIDHNAAANNVIIGNKFHSDFVYDMSDNLEEALQGADFVVISILPGTFNEMESDVHAPEKYGIYQSVGDTTGPGGVFRALRTIPMYDVIARAIKKVAPEAWVINYTNPMGVCVRMLYHVFPQIKAFGCCHEVFGTQELLAYLVEQESGVKGIAREAIKVNVQGLNHFTWLNKATYDGKDLFPLYREAAQKYVERGLNLSQTKNWMNNHFACANCVKFDLFNRYGIIAAAGDRHLAEFCPSWYLKSPEVAHKYQFSLTPVSWRKENLERLLQESRRKVTGEEEVKVTESGEEGVLQMRALLGLGDFITNVNLPNRGQIGNIHNGVVVETNAVFSRNSVTPLNADEMDADIIQLTQPHIYLQDALIESWDNRSFEPAFKAFCVNPLVHLVIDDARALFNEMKDNTKAYLMDYDK